MNIHLLSKTQKTCPPPSEAKTQISAELGLLEYGKNDNLDYLTIFI